MTDHRIKFHLHQAYLYASQYSHDDNTQVGAIVITSWYNYTYGANRFTSLKQCLPSNLERSRKYPRIEHAERDAIFKATREGITLNNASIVCPWATCSDCARAIVLSGIKTVYAHKEALDKTTERWKDSIEVAKEILKDGGVEYILWSGKVGDCTNLFDGEIWYP